MLFALLNAALSSNGSLMNGMSREAIRYVPITMITMASMPAAKGDMPRPGVPPRISPCPRSGRSVFVPWLPGELPIAVLPTSVALVAGLALLASAPEHAVFGYGFECRWLSARSGPLAGALDGPPSLFGPCGVAMMMKRCQVPFLSPSDSRLPVLRKKSTG